MKKEKTLLWKIGLIVISWVAFVALDFFFHAGLFSKIFTRNNPALLGARELFYRIPFGYLSFLIFIVIIYWLLSKLKIQTWKEGFWFGIKLGSLLSLTSILGLYSILTLDFDMLVVWGLVQAIELGMIGGMIGAANSGVSLGRLAIVVVALFVVSVVLTITLQAVGLAPQIGNLNN